MQLQRRGVRFFITTLHFNISPLEKSCILKRKQKKTNRPKPEKEKINFRLQNNC